MGMTVYYKNRINEIKHVNFRSYAERDSFVKEIIDKGYEITRMTVRGKDVVIPYGRLK